MDICALQDQDIGWLVCNVGHIGKDMENSLQKWARIEKLLCASCVAEKITESIT